MYNAQLIQSVLVKAEQEAQRAYKRGNMALFLRFTKEALDLKLQLKAMEA